MSLQQIDNLDDRREIHRLLMLLSPLARTTFLHWCATTTNKAIMVRHNPPWLLVRIENQTEEAAESYWDLMMMISQYGLDPDVVLPELERRAAQARYTTRSPLEKA